jgi:phage FluMu protein Com
MRTYSIEFMRSLAAEKGGECLSEQCSGSHDKLRFRCEAGHEWIARASAVAYGGWCRACFATSRRLSLEQAYRVAEQKGGQCLSTAYDNSKTKLDFECGKGHRFAATLEKVKSGRWCPTCGRAATTAALSYTIEDVAAKAREFGGECLSSEYKGIFEKLMFRCANGHDFKREPALIFKKNPRQVTWCPHCKGVNYSENLCRSVFEIAFGNAFPNYYPGDWLLNANGRKMQLDGYCQELKLAFEYHGHQHYQPVARFNMSAEDVVRRQAEDALKRRLCRENGVALIEIPFFPRIGMPLPEVVSHVEEAIQREGLALPKFQLSALRKRVAYYGLGRLNELKELARERGGELLSERFSGMNARMHWRCGTCGHDWWQSANPIAYAGTWCPRCNGPRLVSIEDMKELARERGGLCLSETYVNTKTHLKWRCSRGHEWPAMPLNVQKGHWCPECPKEDVLRKSEQRLSDRVSALGGKFFGTYRGSKEKLTFECASAHRWSAAPEGILYSGSWCPDCARQRRRPRSS